MNHKDADYKKKYDPVKFKEQLPCMNTMAAGQTSVWLARFKKIIAYIMVTFPDQITDIMLEAKDLLSSKMDGEKNSKSEKNEKPH